MGGRGRMAMALVVVGALSGWFVAAASGQMSPGLSAPPDVLDPVATSVLTVTGSNYLVPPHVAGADVFGGVYVFFGWVAPGGHWGPSNRSATSDAGQFGTTYTYPGDNGG